VILHNKLPVILEVGLLGFDSKRLKRLEPGESNHPGEGACLFNWCAVVRGRKGENTQFFHLGELHWTFKAISDRPTWETFYDSTSRI